MKNVDERKTIINEYVKKVSNYLQEEGSVFTHITIFADKLDKTEDEEKINIIHIPLPPELLKSDEGKETMIKQIFPQISEELHKKFRPYGVAFTTEAWVRVADKEQEIPKNWKDLPISKEVLMINFEFEDYKQSHISVINRLGKQVNSDGNYIDRIELEDYRDLKEGESLSGRFSNLYDIFIARS